MKSNQSNPIIFVKVSRDQDIKRRDFSVISTLIKKLEKEPTRFYNTVHILFSGYEHVDEEVFEIREIRNWIEELVFLHPEILYYLEQEMYGLENIILCISDYKMYTKIQVDKGDKEESLVYASIPTERAEALLLLMTTNTTLNRHPAMLEIATKRLMSYVAS